jgi:hypothetical protein
MLDRYMSDPGHGGLVARWIAEGIPPTEVEEMLKQLPDFADNPDGIKRYVKLADDLFSEQVSEQRKAFEYRPEPSAQQSMLEKAGLSGKTSYGPEDMPSGRPTKHTFSRFDAAEKRLRDITNAQSTPLEALLQQVSAAETRPQLLREPDMANEAPPTVAPAPGTVGRFLNGGRGAPQPGDLDGVMGQYLNDRVGTGSAMNNVVGQSLAPLAGTGSQNAMTGWARSFLAGRAGDQNPLGGGGGGFGARGPNDAVGPAGNNGSGFAPQVDPGLQHRRQQQKLRIAREEMEKAAGRVGEFDQGYRSARAAMRNSRGESPMGEQLQQRALLMRLMGLQG